MENYFYRKLVFAKSKSSGTSNYADIDNLTITENENGEIQAVGVLNDKDKETLVKLWTGTKAEYDAIEEKDDATLYNITDDYEEPEIVANKTTIIDANSTDTQYPSAKAVYDIVQNGPGAALDDVVPKQTATDSIINVNDALKYKTFNFKVDGAYEQNGEPTPETPIPITTLIFDKITKIGQNLLPNTFFSKHADISVDNNGWATVTFDNTSDTSIKFLNFYHSPAKIKPSTNYNVFLEIKNVSGTGSIVVCSYATFDNQEEGQFSTSFRENFQNLQSGKIYNKICLSRENLNNNTTSSRAFVQADAGQAGSITFRISVIEDTSVTPENFVYQPYQETNYQIDLQGNEMVGLPNGVKDELQIDKEGNVSLVKRIGKKIINEADLNGINDVWFTLIDYLRLNKPNDYIGYNKVALSNSYNNMLLNKFHRSPKETPRETYDDVYSIIEYQSTSNFALTIPKGQL